METSNLLIILSDEHSRNASGCYGNAQANTPNIDALARRGTRFTNAYTNCPICIPARASIATGEYVHRIGYWDNGQPYDGNVRSWHHVLRDEGTLAASVGKLHFKGQGSDHGFAEEIDPLHVVDGIGDVLGCLRDDSPRRHKRAGIDEAGPGDSTYIRYDASNADAAIRWLAEHRDESTPWVLFVGFVLPHPPYIAPVEECSHVSRSEVSLPPQWKHEQWPRHPVISGFREAFDFDRPFSEDTVRRVNTAYLGACEYLDSQVGRVIDSIEDFGLLESTRVLYTSDHGEDRGARGLFGKFTMYEESAGIPMVLSGPGIPIDKTVATPVSLVDIYPTVLESAGVRSEPQKPGVSLMQIAQLPDRDRVAFAEYHALGCRRGFFMVRYGRYKYVYYVDAPTQLFDLETDPDELTNLAGNPEYAAAERELAQKLGELVDPEAVDMRARKDQQRVVESFGGRDALIARGAFDNSPVPGEQAAFHV